MFGQQRSPRRYSGGVRRHVLRFLCLAGAVGLTTLLTGTPAQAWVAPIRSSGLGHRGERGQ